MTSTFCARRAESSTDGKGRNRVYAEYAIVDYARVPSRVQYAGMRVLFQRIVIWLGTAPSSRLL